MNRLVSVLLIAIFVLGQALPHSHAGSGMSEPVDHNVRPHVHLSSSHSHHHHGSDDHGHDHPDEDHSKGSGKTRSLSNACDHDADAIFVVQPNNSVGRSTTVLQVSDTTDCVFDQTIADGLSLHPLDGIKRRHDRSRGLPIYLLVASLRL